MKKSNVVKIALLFTMVMCMFSKNVIAEDRIELDDHIKVHMTQEIYELWSLFLEEQNARSNDKRYENIKEYSETLAEAVYFYQTEGEVYKGKHVRLPVHWNTHLVIATRFAIESHLKADAVGKIGEVGLPQLNYYARNKYKPKEILDNPTLGIYLGVRWMAWQITLCKTKNLMNWNDEKWIGPMSSYCAGIGSVWDGKKRKCNSISVAKRTIKKMKHYRKIMLEQYGKLLYDMLTSGGD